MEKGKRKQKRSVLGAAVIGFVYAGLTLAAWFSPEKEFSDSERRKLAQLPELSCAAISNGSFMKDFEKYTQDQFPLRNAFRGLKAVTTYDVLGQLDNHGIYVKNGYAAKLEYQVNTD